ncbi:MAG: hypothetical protein ABIS50_08875 [Luteolibacter sp.]|uniref:hypothetical protein n=1 Tax=Luteolibacter sp. TaxID=1962973 RepID=UPI0032657EB8
MISLLPSQALPRRSMKISEDVRQYAAQQGISEEEALENGMEDKSSNLPMHVRRSIFRGDWVILSK